MVASRWQVDLTGKVTETAVPSEEGVDDSRRMLAELLRRVPGGPVSRIYRFLENPVQTQERLLRSLLRRAAETEWGRRFRFDEIGNEQDLTSAYRDAVPLHTYDDLREDVERIRAGTPDVIWPGTFSDFAVSSGTASAGKIIPVSRETLQANKRFSMGMMYNYVAQTGKVAFLGGRFLSLPGRIEEDARYPGTWVGEVSGLQARYAPAVVKRYYQAVSNETLFLPNWEEKLDAIVDQTLKMDVRSTVMVPTWALVLFEKLLDRFAEVNGWRPETIRDVWPKFSVFFSGGVALSSYRDLLEQQTGSGSVDFMEAYGASEGFFGFQMHPADRDMVLHLDNGVYYEFVPVDDRSDKPRRLKINEVETGVRYQMFVTTSSGLWAYGVGDVVKFTSVRPYRIVVAGRTSEMIDKYGEAVFGDEARAALLEACQKLGAAVADYHIAPSLPDRRRLPSHQWLVEFERVPDDTGALSALIDEYLQRVNRHYQIRREAKAFDAPEIVVLPRGSFYRWMKETRARVSAQSKVPRMSEERHIADSLLKLTGFGGGPTG